MASLLSLVLVVPAHAEDEALEEVVVSAGLMAEDAQRSSFTLIDTEIMRQRAAEHLADVLSAAPNVNFASGASRGRFLQIRGVGERSQFVEPLNASVATLLDGIDLTGLGGAATLFDLSQVEILRGPQGTLLGANALAGLINLRSTPADSGKTLGIVTGLENYGGQRIGATLGGPINDGTAVRLAVNNYRSNGTIDNTWLGRDDTNNIDETTVRAQLAWESSRHRIDVGAYHIDVDNGYDAFSLDNTRNTLSDAPGSDRLTTDALRLRWTGFGDTIEKSVQLSMARTDTDYSYDEDWSFVGIAPGWEYSSFDRYRRDRDMFSLEGRARSTDNSATQWVAGVYIREEDESLRRDYTYLAGPFTSDLDISTAAIFGQVDQTLTPELSIFIGARLEQRRTDYADSAAIDEGIDDNLWSGRMGLEWAPNPENRVYVALARGVRAGGVNASLLASIEAIEPPPSEDLSSTFGFFDEESLLSTEIGWHFTAADGQLSSTLTAFHMQRRDQQARGSLVIPREDGSTAFIDYTDNAAEGTNQGIEWEGRWTPNADWSLAAALGLLDATFDDYTSATGEDLSGRDQPQAPSYQYRLAADWRATNTLSLGLELTGMDDYLFSDRHEVRSEERLLLNGHIGWQRGGVTLRLWGRNLSNETYTVRGFGTFGNDPRKEYALEPYYQFGEPRMFGLTLEYDFLHGET
ncbi:TonB-dependent receptor [Luminiphilus syltensis NOR5-1B]|uniref:TonB-dependent receptor n=1 Tax=Luminiphilus syltensis NOR5-1B TaxID=565045 RepID=B8KQN3_9GAMM|nr:TonB-dependent receptor [Luminiphilus syltensis NOR5-1B]